ncbi:colicin V production protein [Skermanella stibiiresistens SB22]|uniref:Colicin V production protein n=1 Tax=Skermanella stibiiresistens SB22 TaxID=1385369 RepID=W9H868_9PROT|nr:CvpA family protein [Skermanella stibiiresistens]EWY39998.1 colicin V production protein [Skermanella stibiiresistens SB22]
MDSTSINPTDIAVIVILLLSALLAFARGLVREVLSVGAWVGAAFATLYLFPHALPLVQQVVAKELIAKAVAGLSVFFVSLILLSIVSHQISKGVRGSALSAVDRSLGFVFGIARGAVIVCLAYLTVAWVFPPTDQPKWLREARTMPVIQTGAEMLRNLVPDRTRATTDSQAANAAATAANTARMATEQATQAVREEALKRLSTPKPPMAAATNASAPVPDSGYKDRDRTELDRLIETNR